MKITYTDANSNTLECESNGLETIIESFEKNGIKLPLGCLAGSCGACKIEVINGDIKEASPVEADTINFLKSNLASRLNDQSFLTKNIRLACRAKPKSDLKIKAIK